MINREVRNRCIGASEIAAACGLDSYTTPMDLYLSKRYGFEGAPSARARKGKHLERGILAMYAEDTGRTVQYLDETHQSERYPFLAVTPDALCENEPRGVDAKLAGPDRRDEWGETEEDLPARVLCQAHAYLADYDYEVWDIAVLVGFDDFRIYTIHRERELEEIMLDLAATFHRRYIAGDEIPDIGGSTLATRWLQQTYPKHKKPDMRPATEAEVQVLAEYCNVRNAFKHFKTERARLENRLRLAIAEREGIRWPQGKITWRNTKDREITNWEGLARGLLTEKDAETRKTLMGLQTRTKPGGRRLHIKSEWLTAEDDEDETKEITECPLPAIPAKL